MPSDKKNYVIFSNAPVTQAIMMTHIINIALLIPPKNSTQSYQLTRSAKINANTTLLTRNLFQTKSLISSLTAIAILVKFKYIFSQSTIGNRDRNSIK